MQNKINSDPALLLTILKNEGIESKCIESAIISNPKHNYQIASALTELKKVNLYNTKNSSIILKYPTQARKISLALIDLKKNKAHTQKNREMLLHHGNCGLMYLLIALKKAKALTKTARAILEKNVNEVHQLDTPFAKLITCNRATKKNYLKILTRFDSYHQCSSPSLTRLFAPSPQPLEEEIKENIKHTPLEPKR